jgi:hypothetical protein
MWGRESSKRVLISKYLSDLFFFFHNYDLRKMVNLLWNGKILCIVKSYHASLHNDLLALKRREVSSSCPVMAKIPAFGH